MLSAAQSYGEGLIQQLKIALSANGFDRNWAPNWGPIWAWIERDRCQSGPLNTRVGAGQGKRFASPPSLLRAPETERPWRDPARNIRWAPGEQAWTARGVKLLCGASAGHPGGVCCCPRWCGRGSLTGCFSPFDGPPPLRDYWHGEVGKGWGNRLPLTATGCSGPLLPGLQRVQSGKVLLDPLRPGVTWLGGSTTARRAQRHGAQHQLLLKGVGDRTGPLRFRFRPRPRHSWQRQRDL